MRILSAPFGAVTLGLGLFVTNPLPAFGQCCGGHSCRAGGMNMMPPGSGAMLLPNQMPTSSSMMPTGLFSPNQLATYNAMRYPVMPFYPQVPGYFPTVNTSQAATTSSSSSATSSVSSANVLPTPSKNADKTDAPVEPAVRLRYVELSVSGLENAADKDRLTAALDTLKGSRGASVKGKPGTTVTVKVWYSDKEPIEADTVLQGVTKLGFTAKVVGS